jgi:hypothetical protein
MLLVPLATGSYLHWGVVQISLANLLIVVAMLVLFVAALVVPFPHPVDPGGGEQP